MNRFKKHLLLAGILFSTFFCFSNFATNTISTRHTLVDSVRLYATRTTTTIPNNVNIDITVGNFMDINTSIFTIEWDATKLQFLSIDNTFISAFSTTNIDISAVASGKIHFTWTGTPLTLVDGAQIFKLRFSAQVASSSPILINFTDDAPIFPTVFKNSSNQLLPLASSFGQVRIVNCTTITPSLTCRNATLLCAKDLPVCGRLPASNIQDDPGRNISCGNIQNNIWLAFIAGSDSLKLKIKVSNCNGAGDGVQVSVLETNDCLSYTRLACNPGIRNGEEMILAVPENGLLTIGKQYYLMLDGFNGDICDFQIDILSGSISSSFVAAPTISGAASACSNQTNSVYSIPTQSNDIGYIWKIKNNNATILSGNNTSSINVNWGTVSDSVCVRVVGRCDTTLWNCKSVTVGSQTIRDLTIEKCSNTTYFFNNQNISNPGTYSVTLRSSSGCDSVVNLTLLNYPSVTRMIDSTVCIGSSVIIGSSNHSVAGTHRDTLRGAGFHGCDSIVVLNLLVIQSNVSLTPQNPVLTCQLPSATLTASYTREPSSAIPTFEWTNIGTGQVISTNSTATVTQTGSYKFKLTLSLNGISCSQERTIAVTRTGAVPAKPDLTGVVQSCTGSPETFRINSPSTGTTYNWAVTGGTFSGAGSSQIVVNWNANNTSAKVCVDAENGCGKSDSICKTVDLAFIPTPLSIIGDATVCPSATGNYSVPVTANVSNYQWTVTNGTITSGQGSAAVAVAWGTTATGRVCMTPSNRCGTGQQSCFDVEIKNAQPDSLPIVGNTTVCSNDTTVFTNNTAGNIQFNWDVPTGATILRGQGTNTILVVWGSALDNQTVGLTLTNSCNLTRRVTLGVVIKNAALAAPVIAGTATICPMSRANYSIPSDAAIVAYKWTVPAGATVVGSSTSSAVLIDWGSSIGGNVCVEIQNNCNAKKTACFSVEVKTTLDSLPLLGGTLVCKDSTVAFEVQNDPNAVGYLWVVPTGASIVNGLNTNRIVVRFGSSSGYVRVVPLGGCADGQPSRRYVTVKLPPSAPANIVGTTILCEGAMATFSIAAIPEVSAYQWQVPNGAHIVGDSTGNQITVNLGTSRGGQLCARGVNACGAGFWTCTTITILMKPTVNAGKDTIVCGNQIILRGQTTVSVQTWSVIDKPVGAVVSFLTPFDIKTDILVSKSGVYIFKFESADAIGCGRADSVKVEFKELPGLAVASEDCNLEAVQYTVKLNITGTASPYTMMGSVSGVLTSSGNGFTSNPIPNGTTYNFTVKDQFGCVSNEVRGVKNCPCYTAVGNLRQDPIVVCFGATGRAIHLNDSRLDGNDTYEFILHDGSATLRGNILKRNRTGIFDASSLQLGRIYYIAYIVGDSLANGSVDLTKPCAAVSTSVSIVFKNRLVAGLTGDTTICRNSNTALTFKINQTGTYSVSLRDETGTRYLNNVFNGQTLNVSPLSSTTYRLLEVKDIDGCLAELTDSARVNLKQLPISNAGVDRSVCQTNTVLEAAENLQYVGRWSSLTNNVQILTPSDPKSAVTNLQNGRNIFVWSVADTTCPNYTVSSTVNIFLPLLPKANTLSLVTTVGKPVSGSVSENAPTGTYTITQLTNPAAGSFSLFNNGNFTYHPDSIFTGIVKFKFVVCSDLCTRLCDTGEVRILINPKPVDSVVVTLDIPNAITPNGDGKNDILQIDGLDQYPNNELVIFNRWGDILYKSKPYMNDWQGVNQNGGELPEGTYYYVLRLNVNDGKVFSGNMTILR